MYRADTHERLRFKLLPYIVKTCIMEAQTLKMLEHHARQFREFPDVHARVSQYVEKTEHHLGHMEQLLKLYHEEPPSGGGASSFHFFKDTPVGTLEEVLPNPLARSMVDEYFFMHLEIAMYSILDTLARVYGDTQVVRVTEQILCDKLEMQRWLLDNLPEAIMRVLEQDGVSVPPSAWEFAKQPELTSFLGTSTSSNIFATH